MTEAVVTTRQVGNKIFERVAGLYTGWVPCSTATDPEPVGLQWTGGKLPYVEYCKMVSFFRWTYKEFHGESQVRLAYNSATGEMKVVVLPQSASSGMSTKELGEDPERASILESEMRGFEFCGTAHHHCTTSAFQSGVDKSDELTQVGLHLTIGKVDEKAVDYDARVTFRGHQYAKEECNIRDWIGLPVDLAPFPSEVQSMLMEWYLKNPARIEFPDAWKERMRKPSYPSYGKEDAALKGAAPFSRGSIAGPWNPASASTSSPPRSEKKGETPSSESLNPARKGFMKAALESWAEQFNLDMDDVISIADDIQQEALEEEERKDALKDAEEDLAQLKSDPTTDDSAIKEAEETLAALQAAMVEASYPTE